MTNYARSTSLTAMVAIAAIAVIFVLAYRSWGDLVPGQGERAATPLEAAGQPGAPERVDRLSALFPRTQTHDFVAPIPGSYKLPVIKLAGDGKLTDHTGRATTLHEEYEGNISLLSFIYTSCRDAAGCPLATGLLFDIFHVSNRSRQLAANTKLVTVSFDPVRDDPQVMATYGQSALEDEDRETKMAWRFLTASSRADLEPILSSYGQTISIATDADTLKHVLRMYLIDRQGRIRNVYGLGFLDPRLLLADIETLLIEEAQNKGS